MMLDMRTSWRFLRSGCVTLACLLVLDGLWLMSTMEPLYRRALASHLAPLPDLRAAGLFYVLYAIGLTVLAVRPGEPRAGWRYPLGRGAVFGLVAYGTYDLTNQATLSDWPWALTAIDMAWGTVLSGLCAAVAAGMTGWGGKE